MNWLFLRGLVREQRHWGKFPQFFEKRFPGNKVYCLDFPGVGTELSRSSPRSVALIAEDVRGRWLELRSTVSDPSCSHSQWSLLSVSLGAMVGLSWAASYPKDFQRAVFCNLSASDVNPVFKRLRLKHVTKILQLLLANDPEHIERNILQMVSANHANDPAVISEWSSYLTEPGTVRETLIRQLWAASRFKTPDRISVPALFLRSLGDDLVDPECTRKIAQKYSLPVQTHLNAGHDLFLDDPEWALEQIAQWIGLPAKV